MIATSSIGPGATNMVTGIATAMMDSSPIVCITGQVARPAIGGDAFQETDVTGVTLPVTKHNYLVGSIEELVETIREAFFIAKSSFKNWVLEIFFFQSSPGSGIPRKRWRSGLSIWKY